MKRTMKKKLTLNKIEIAALNDKEKKDIFGGLSGLCGRTHGCTLGYQKTCLPCGANTKKPKTCTCHC